MIFRSSLDRIHEHEIIKKQPFLSLFPLYQMLTFEVTDSFNLIRAKFCS